MPCSRGKAVAQDVRGTTEPNRKYETERYDKFDNERKQ